MSGISGYSDIGGGVAPQPMEERGDYCLNLVIRTNLSTVNTEALGETQVGDVLPVVTGGIDGPVQVLKDDKVLGTVLSSRLVELLNCINNGTEYDATVEKIDGAICQVKIAAVR